MEISLATLDVVVEVGPELVDQVDGVIPVCWSCVSREQHKCYVAEIIHCKLVTYAVNMLRS